MDISLRRYYIFLLLVLTVEATDTSHNETSQEHRQSRVTGRIVKIYSGPRPDPIHCTGEGFLADPHNCAVFYRCMKSGNGKFTVFRFQCGPGTVYDPETEVCNHPRSTKRSECGGASISTENDIEKNNEIEIQPEIPSPITNKPSLVPKPTLIDSFITNSPISDLTWAASNPALSTSTKWDSLISFMPSTLYPKEQPMSPTTSTTTHAYNLFNTQSTPNVDSSKITSTTKPATVVSVSASRGIICTSDGFVGDFDDCRKFYRCVANNRGTYTRYEFSCSESTVWDDDTQSCNHAWAVKRSRCGRSNHNSETANRPNTVSTLPPNASTDKTIQQQLQVSYGSKVTQTQTQISNGSVIQNQTQINFGDRLNENKNTEAEQNQTQISHGSAVSQTQTQIDYSDKGVQTQLQIDHSQQSSQTQVQVHESTTRGASTSKDSSTTSAGNQSNNKCSRSGFMGDTNDCKKFYRCVDSGRGSYTQYEFSCGEGTVWDQSIEACNHAWAVKECGGKEPSQTPTTTSTTQTSSSFTQNYYTTTSTGNDYSSPAPVATEDYEDSGYGHQPVQPTISTSTTTTTTTTTTERSATTASPSKGDCQSSGFLGDVNDCKIFYRCVENGRGGFTKYEFKCGEGTVWDPEIKACNHAWAVKQCGGNASPDIEKVETTTYKQTSQSSTTQIQTTTIKPSSTLSSLTQNDDYDTGYGSGNNDFTTKTTTSTEPPVIIDQNTDNVCRASGFMGDKNDCKKFYRCVDNGNGGFTRYEFTCGEGTVWDSKIEACNHAWAVEKCGGSGPAVDYETTTKPTTSYVIPSSSSTEGYQVTNSPTVGSSTLSSTSTVSESLSPTSNNCTRSGFMGDSKDCKKFYRCVDNGSGSYTKYEFSCGEGTVWDQKIEACNHAWAVEKCGDSPDSSSSAPEITPEPQPTLSDEIENGYPITEGTGVYTTTQKITTSTTEVSKEPSEVCTTSGFVGDKRDCKKFYRCVDDGKGGYIRYEFSCGEGTLWDQSIEACNHAWAVKKDCAAESDIDTVPTSSHPSSTQVLVTTESENQGYPQYTEKTSTSTVGSYPDTGVRDKCYQEGFMGDSNDCKKFYRCVDNGRGGFTQYQFVCGEGTYWNQEILACDHATSENSCKNLDNTISSDSPPSNDEMFTEATPSQSSTEEIGYSSQKPQVSSGTCTSEGFYGDQNDCKKFYRCVDNGKGGYTKYDFTCGDGTVWDSEIQACNHESSNNKCSSYSTSGTTQSTQTEYNGSTSSSTTEWSTEKTETSSSSSSYQCTSEGFFAHPNDCKKFIRCVSNDRGGYTKYEFTCGEGTVWVQDILACDHDNDDSNCSSMSSRPSPSSSTEGLQQTTEKYDPSSPSDQSQQPVMNDEENTQPTTESTTTVKSSSESSQSIPSENKDTCENEGYYGNSQDCKMFYRCVDNGKGGYTKYDFTCGEGTIWDQDVTTCNHPQDVMNPSCKQNQAESTSTPPSSSSTTTSTTFANSSPSDTSGTTTTTENTQSSSNCSQEESKKPGKQNFTCDKAGYYPNPNDCKKFYRCVDWDGDGKRYSIYHFDCGEGTIWDPAVETCNHEESVYPPRDCSGSQSQSESQPTDSTTSTQSTASTQSSTEPTTQSSTESTSTQSTSSEQTTTQQSTTSDVTTTQESTSSEQTSTTEQTTTQQSTSSQQTTTEKSTTEQSSTQSTTEQSTTESSTTQSTTEQSTTESSTTQSTTEQSTTESTTTQSTTDQSTTESTTTQSTTDKTTTQQSTTEQSTTEQSTSEQSTTSTSEQSTTEQSTTEQSTTEPSSTEQSTTEQSATEQSTTEQSTTGQSTTEQYTTEQSTTEQSTTEQSTTEQSTTESSTTNENTTQLSTTTEQTEQSTTEESSGSQSTTESSTDNSTTEQTTGSNNKCPETDNDQHVFVCPTSFRRHPKYCNLFYQCDEDDDTHDAKIAIFTCPNNTIYDESQTRCVEESKADKKCDGQIAQRRRFKRLNKNYKEPLVVTKDSQACPSAGYFSFEKDSECSPAFLKCKTDTNKKLRGLVYQCPSGYLFWSISKRCEPINRIKDCKRSQNNWTERWEIPIERRNVAPL